MEVSCRERYPTPWGVFRAHWNGDGALVALDLPGRWSEDEPDAGRRPPAAPPRHEVRRWLLACLRGEGPPFPGSWRLPGRTPFQRRVYRRLCRVPPGRTVTYGELARTVGSPRAARAVGAAMAANPLPLLVPCHRVVAVAGLGGYGGGLDLKARLLAAEARSGRGRVQAAPRRAARRRPAAKRA